MSANPQTIREHLEAQIRDLSLLLQAARVSPILRDAVIRVERHAVAALAELDKRTDGYVCMLTGELVSEDDAAIYGRPGHRTEPADGEVWTEDCWCDCAPMRVAVVPDPAPRGDAECKRPPLTDEQRADVLLQLEHLRGSSRHE